MMISCIQEDALYKFVCDITFVVQERVHIHNTLDLMIYASNPSICWFHFIYFFAIALITHFDAREAGDFQTCLDRHY